MIAYLIVYTFFVLAVWAYAILNEENVEYNSFVHQFLYKINCYKDVCDIESPSTKTGLYFGLWWGIQVFFIGVIFGCIVIGIVFVVAGFLGFLLDFENFFYYHNSGVNFSPYQKTSHGEKFTAPWKVLPAIMLIYFLVFNGITISKVVFYFGMITDVWLHYFGINQNYFPILCFLVSFCMTIFTLKLRQKLNKN